LDIEPGLQRRKVLLIIAMTEGCLVVKTKNTPERASRSAVPFRGAVPNTTLPKIRGKYSTKGLTIQEFS
jgi:hypothetical protein